jgi:hypothetical protein
MDAGLAFLVLAVRLLQNATCARVTIGASR